MEEAARERLIDEFRTYLETAPDSPTCDVEPDPPDLFSLMAELAALKAEVKGESRQLKSALDTFRGLFESLQQTNTRLSQELESARDAAAQQGAAAERALLLELLELADRMQAGAGQARRYRAPWLGRRKRVSAFVAAMADGMAMNLTRLDAILARREVQRLQTVGRPYDPLTMHAADVNHDPARADGEVLAEQRAGYLRQGRLLRAAEVVVNRRAATDP